MLAFGVVDEGLVHRPCIDAAFWAVAVVNRAAIKAEGLSLAVKLAGFKPAFARSRQPVGRRRFDKIGNNPLHGLRGNIRIGVGGMDQRGIVLRDRVESWRLRCVG